MASQTPDLGMFESAVKWVFGLIALSFAAVIAFFSASFRSLTNDVSSHGQKIATLEEQSRNVCERVDGLGDRMDQGFQRLHERLDNFQNRTNH